ncbi:hypothetical protein NLI96_g12006 [Meripilus lineatus]|uniref:Uncharacterized protein n=1 Tax=Meripilus lineatus TaxID=2056292 RepID=A0AAD5UVM3_9APHY|nr:hypothetical protein NLI96_g12006 [Physisporinus lineatus]
MQSCKLPIEVCERVIDNLALQAHNPTLVDYGEALESIPTLSLIRHPYRAQLVHFLRISPRPPPPPSSPESASPSDLPDSPASTSSTLSSESPALSASPVAPSSSHSSQNPISVSNDQHVEETPPQSESDNLAHVPTTKPSEFDVSSRDQTQDKIEGKTSIPPCYYNWIYKVLTRLPPLLINLSILYLDKLPTLHPRFIRLVSCFKTIRMLFLSNLENQSFSEITQVINRFPQLRSINFLATKWDRPVRFFPSRSLRLEGIYCGANDEHSNTDVLDWLGSLQDLSRLRLLRIDPFHRSDLNKVHRILQRCIHSLEFLDLLSADANVSESLSLSGHLKLEYIRIVTPSLHLSQNLALFSSRISQILSPSLVYLIIGDFEDLELESLATSLSSWTDIDNALSQPKFNRLAYFVMSLSRSHKGNIDHETLRATFQKILPQSYQRGILWVEKYIDTIDEWRDVVQHFIFAKTMSASSARLSLGTPTFKYEIPLDVKLFPPPPFVATTTVQRMRVIHRVIQYGQTRSLPQQLKVSKGN